MHAPDEVDPLGRGQADHGRILEVLARHEVGFLVVGGLAVRAHGYPRGTLDVDVLPDPSESNMRRLASALAELKASAIDERGRSLPVDLSRPGSLARGNSFLTTDLGPLDLVNGPRPDLKRYRRLESRAIEIELGGTALKFIGIDDLIRMKREAGRDKDLRDIAALSALERHGNERS